MSNSNISGNSNIVIQDVNESTITINVNGEVQHIKNELSELKELLKSRQNTTITYESKIYNIEHINEANFGMVTSHKVFNGQLTRDLMQLLSDKPKPGNFLSSLPPEDLENLEKSEYLNDAQLILVESYIWAIGWELRRLFALSNDAEKSMETKIKEYTRQCSNIYRVAIQIINYLFISALWDEKTKNPGLETNKPSIKAFFISQRRLKLNEQRILFQDLLRIFKDNQLPFPVEEEALGNLEELLNNESAFNKACIEMEKLKAMENSNTPYGLGHCHTAEISLITILSAFRFFSDYQLETIKEVEYEEARNAPARYIKDMNTLEGLESNTPSRRLIYEEAPSVTYSVFFSDGINRVSLFPFLLDYNALTGEADFQIYFYECMVGQNAIRFYSIKNGNENATISYTKTEFGNKKIKSENEKNELLKSIRLDLVIKQFESAMNTILGSKFQFEPD